MFDDLDDLLNDNDYKPSALTKSKPAATTKKPLDDDFDFDDPAPTRQQTFGQKK